MNILSTPGTQTPIGYLPPPLTDEPLDGYLEYVTHRLVLRPGVVRAHFGLLTTERPITVQGLSETEARKVASATGWSVADVHAMTLRRYAPAGLMPAIATVGGGPGPWLRRRGSRFCPACLRERDGRWRLSWYLQWTFICTDHATLLDVVCPTCGRVPRTRRGGHPHGETPAPHTGDGSTQDCRCANATLAAADFHRSASEEVLDRRVPEPFLQAQRLITDRITRPQPVPYLGLERPSIEWVHDLAALTRLLAVNAPHDRLPTHYAEILNDAEPAATHVDGVDPLTSVLAAWTPHWRLQPYTAPAARFTHAGASRVAFPVLATLASTILAADSIHTATDLLTRLLPADTRRAAAIQSRRRGISWPLAQALWLAEHHLPPTRLRTIRMGGDRFRPDGSERVPLEPARLPARPWPAVRQTLPWTARAPFPGLAWSAALLIAATSRRLSSACELLNHHTHADRVAYETRRIFAVVAEATGDDVFDDLLALHDAITTGSIPIDYQRRRHVFTSPVALAHRTATRAARELGLRPTPRLARFMSWWIYEQLSGNDILLDPALLHMPGAIRSIYARQRTEWDSEPPAVLLRRAEHALLVNCIDEPITWTPTRTEGDTWTCPPPEITRQLDWSRRHRRAQTLPTRPAGSGLTLSDAVALARSGQSAQTDRLARMLARFHAIVEAPTIAAAANDLHLSQATLSRVLSTLETELDTALFTRTHQANVLTEDGRRLHRLLRIKPITHIDPTKAHTRSHQPAHQPEEAVQ